MTFTITYRSQSGALQKEVVEAANRAAALEQAKARGITPVSVKEGGTLATAAKVAAKQPTWIKGAIAGLVVVIAAVIAFFCLMPTEKPAAPKVEKPKKVKVEKPVKTGNIQAAKTNVSTKVVNLKPPSASGSVVDVKPILGKTPTGEDYVAMTAKTNEDGVVTERFQLPDGRWKRVIHLQTKETAVFDNDLDLALALIATTPMDQQLPPMPELGDLDELFKKAIASPIPVKETDSERVRAMKEGARQLRKEVAELMGEGYSIRQILNEHQNLREQNIVLRHEFQTELNRLSSSGNMEEAQKYCETMNEALMQKGLMPIRMPGTGKSKRREK